MSIDQGNPNPGTNNKPQKRQLPKNKNEYYYRLIGKKEDDKRLLPMIRFCGNPLTDGLFLRLLAAAYILCFQIPVIDYIKDGKTGRTAIDWIVFPFLACLLVLAAYLFWKHSWLKRQARKETWRALIPFGSDQKGEPCRRDLFRYSTQGNGYVVLPDRVKNSFSIAAVGTTERLVFGYLDYLVLVPVALIYPLFYQKQCFHVFAPAAIGVCILVLYELIKRFVLFSPRKQWHRVTVQ